MSRPAAPHAVGRVAQFPYGPEHPARGDQRGDQGDGERGQRAVAGGRDHRLHVRLLLGEFHDGIEHEAGALRRSVGGTGQEDGGNGDREVRGAVLDHPLETAVRDTLVVDGAGPQLRGDDGGGGPVGGGDAEGAVLGVDAPGAGLALAGDEHERVPQRLRFDGQSGAEGVDLLAEGGDGGVLGLLQDGVAGGPVGEGGGGAAADGGDEQEGEHEARAEPEGVRPQPRAPPPAPGRAPVPRRRVPFVALVPGVRVRGDTGLHCGPSGPKR